MPEQDNHEWLIPFPEPEVLCRDGKEIKMWMDGWLAGAQSEDAKEYWFEKFKKEANQ
jgi:hypothetical protein